MAEITYDPPTIPAFLASTYHLKPITGCPTNDEVKLIHATIRAAEGAARIAYLLPDPPDANLVTKLEEHLFDVQMARYRSNYNCFVSPVDIAHAPPQLPGYISNVVALEPIVGFPSEEELKTVKLAIRTHEGFANTYMFDDDLNMDLSQYLFELQLARHIQRSAQFKKFIQNMNIQPRATNEGLATIVTEVVTNAGNHPSQDLPHTPTVSPSGTNGLPSSSGNPASLGGDTGLKLETFENIGTALNDLKASHGQTNQLLTKVAEALEAANRILISTQNCQARANGTYVNGHRHELINQRGECLAGSGLPGLWTNGTRGWGKPTDDALACYLQFYGIGSELLEDKGSTKVIAPGMSDRASELLKKYVGLY